MEPSAEKQNKGEMLSSKLLFYSSVTTFQYKTETNLGVVVTNHLEGAR